MSHGRIWQRQKLEKCLSTWFILSCCLWNPEAMWRRQGWSARCWTRVVHISLPKFSSRSEVSSSWVSQPINFPCVRVCVCVCVCVCMCVWLFVALWTVVHQAPLSMEFSRQRYGSGLPLLSAGDLLTRGSNPGILFCRQILYHLSHNGSPKLSIPGLYFLNSSYRIRWDVGRISVVDA